MSTETDAVRLAEIGARCERATEGPWKAQEFPCMDYYSVTGPDGLFAEEVVCHNRAEERIIVRRPDADFIAHAREDVPWLLKLASELLGQLGKADAAWQATESRIVHICQLLNVDYTCEEPETCEQVIERLRGHSAAMREVLRTVLRRAKDGRIACPSVNVNRPEPADMQKAEALLASYTGKPEADVIAAAARFEDADRRFVEVKHNTLWSGHYEDRAKAMRDICEAVVRMREGSGGALEGLEEGGGE